MKQIVIGLGSKARHGKDSVATTIANFCREEGIPVKVLAFADALYAEVNDALKAEGVESVVADIHKNFSTGQWVTADPSPEVSERAPYGKHPKLLQFWGSELRRAQDPAYWVKKWKDEAANFPGVVLAPDVRFLNEARTIKEMGGVTVNVTRLNADGTPFRDPNRPADHPSETELDGYNWDYRLVAHTGEIAWLEYQALNLFDYVYTRMTSEPAKVVSISENPSWYDEDFRTGKWNKGYPLLEKKAA